MSISTSPSSVLTPKLHYDNDGDVALLTAVNDEHGGVIVEMKGPMNSTDFSISLKASLTNWKKRGIKGGWIKLPIKPANLIEVVVHIDTQFVEVLAFRFCDVAHKAFFEKSDFFLWMPTEEHAEQPSVQNHEPLKYILDVCLAKIDKGYSGFSPVQISSTFFGQEREDCLFLNSRDLNH
ncbi:hypothetical protein ZIOFF_059628 [Zingiber officinale]|uniref:Pre-nudix hydrolase domain-containing protein n=1 Tax=Zingiber officinale TaxID=94328 RepID=A0A8J5KMU5_ZINOF|nr:hypothetical protein ZIOFF_059628 [Zingiber officinale]